MEAAQPLFESAMIGVDIIEVADSSFVANTLWLNGLGVWDGKHETGTDAD